MDINDSTFLRARAIGLLEILAQCLRCNDTEIGRLVGVSGSTVSNWFCCKSRPSVKCAKHIIALCEERFPQLITVDLSIVWDHRLRASISALIASALLRQANRTRLVTGQNILTEAAKGYLRLIESGKGGDQTGYQARFLRSEEPED